MILINIFRELKNLSERLCNEGENQRMSVKVYEHPHRGRTVIHSLTACCMTQQFTVSSKLRFRTLMNYCHFASLLTAVELHNRDVQM